MSEQRRLILQVLESAKDHPSAEEVHRRVTKVEPGISMATIYRTLNILADAGLLSRVEFGDHKSHYEEAGTGHHEHLIDVETGNVLEFRDDGIEALLRDAAGRLGYRLLDYRLELFGASGDDADRFTPETRTRQPPLPQPGRKRQYRAARADPRESTAGAALSESAGRVVPHEQGGRQAAPKNPALSFTKGILE